MVPDPITIVSESPYEFATGIWNRRSKASHTEGEELTPAGDDYPCIFQLLFPFPEESGRASR